MEPLERVGISEPPGRFSVVDSEVWRRGMYWTYPTATDVAQHMKGKSEALETINSDPAFVTRPAAQDGCYGKL